MCLWASEQGAMPFPEPFWKPRKKHLMSLWSVKLEAPWALNVPRTWLISVDRSKNPPDRVITSWLTFSLKSINPSGVLFFSVRGHVASSQLTWAGSVPIAVPEQGRTGTNDPQLICNLP